MLGPLKVATIGSFGETAFFHKRSKTLLVTDTIIKVPDEPPEIVADYPEGLLYHARDTFMDEIDDTPD